jgi:hypothetical protein
VAPETFLEEIADKVEKGIATSCSPLFAGEMVIEGPIGPPKVTGFIYCVVTSELGDFVASTEPVSIELLSSISYAYKQAVPIVDKDYSFAEDILKRD